MKKTNSIYKLLLVIIISTIFAGLFIFKNYKLQSSSSWDGPVPDDEIDELGPGQVAEGCVVEDKICDANGLNCTWTAVGRLKNCGDGHLVCPKGTTNNNSCQNCTCAGCSFRWEEINGKTVRRCNRPEYNNVPICCTPNKTPTPAPVVTATPKPTSTPRPTKTPTAPGCISNITCSTQCGLPYRCTNDGCGGQKCCGATTPCTQPTPTSSPKVTPTPTVTATPTQGEPNNCGGTCGSNYNCKGGLFCYNGFCRNPICSNETDCNCKSTSTAPSVLGTTTTSVLPKTGGGLSLVLFSVLTGGLGVFMFKKTRNLR